jgi:hypothetical protein
MQEWGKRATQARMMISWYYRRKLHSSVLVLGFDCYILFEDRTSHSYKVKINT